MKKQSILDLIGTKAYGIISTSPEADLPVAVLTADSDLTMAGVLETLFTDKDRFVKSIYDSIRTTEESGAGPAEDFLDEIRLVSFTLTDEGPIRLASADDE